MPISPEEFARITAAVGERVVRMQAELKIDADGTLVLPFRCYGCDRERYDFALMTGDGLPMCVACIDACCGDTTEISQT